MKFLILITLIFGFGNAFALSFFGSRSFEECLAKENRSITNKMQLEILEKKCRLKFPKLPSIINDSGRYVICKAGNLRPFRIKISKKHKNATFNGDEKQKYPLLYFTKSELMIDMSANFFSEKNFPLQYKIDYLNGNFNWIELGKADIAGSCEEEIN
jgi:hypothetical protein